MRISFWTMQARGKRTEININHTQCNKRVSISQLLVLIGLLVLSTGSTFAARVTGIVFDAQNKERLVGASLTLVNTQTNAVFNVTSGLDGSYSFQSVAPGNYLITITYVGYAELVQSIDVTDTQKQHYEFGLMPGAEELTEIVVSGAMMGTDAQARNIEKAAPTVINVISAKQIQLSPDITVANVIQRVSGLSIERNSSGDPQYAIVRGMDKRYNNTLINGVKVPSPDNENRFVPLDIFPAVFLERLEVYKSLTADMEADAIGGTVNMVMKNAPNGRLLDADFQIGYNQMNVERPFATYDRSRLNKKSPSELHGPTYRATPDDFPVENMIIQEKTPMPDVFANVTYGNRFLNDKLGVMVGGSFQNSYRPVSNYFYDPSVDNTEGNPLIMRELIERETSSQLQRIAFHAKADYALNERHKLSFYVGQYFLNEFRVREQLRRESFVTSNNYAVYPITRVSNIYQTISTYDLGGEHNLNSKLDVNWHAVFSHAKNDRPDDGVFSRAGQYDVQTNTVNNEIVYFQGTRNSRVWERNTDQDFSVYVNATYKPGIINDKTAIQFGGVMRSRTRDNYFNYYNYSQIFGQFRGVDWDDFGDVEFTSMANPLGSGNRSNLVYDATEQVFAGYINTKWMFNNTNIQVGVRAEQTTQGYDINPDAASDDVALTGEQNYLHVFPSLSIKQQLNTKASIKATYFKGISRPGFYEIVPTVRSAGGGDSFYSEMGNADLKPSIGHSADLRFEYFPTGIDQLLFGVFYKHILDPIEYGFPQVANTNTAPVTNRILPQNFDNAMNYGIEADLTKYFNKFGVRANYTFTHSAITTDKIVLEGATRRLVQQSRPLQGQSAHIANLSLLFKDQKYQWDIQLVLNYTGERIAFVSPFYEADHWMRPMTQLDFSVEKGFDKLTVFAKANNLLNTPYQLYVNKPLAVPTDPYPHQTDPYNIGYVRRDLYGQSYRIGLRYNL